MEKTSNCNPQCNRFLGSTERIPGVALKSYASQELRGVGQVYILSSILIYFHQFLWKNSNYLKKIVSVQCPKNSPAQVKIKETGYSEQKSYEFYTQAAKTAKSLTFTGVIKQCIQGIQDFPNNLKLQNSLLLQEDVFLVGESLGVTLFASLAQAYQFLMKLLK